MIIDNIEFVDKNGNQLVKSFDIKRIEIKIINCSIIDITLMIIILNSNEINLIGVTIINDIKIRKYFRKLISKKIILNYIYIISFRILDNNIFYLDSNTQYRQIILL